MTDDLSERLRRLDALDAMRTKGPWEIYPVLIAGRDDAVAELALQVKQTDPMDSNLYLLAADGKCPATTGCGPTSKANAEFIVALENAWPQLRVALEAKEREPWRPTDTDYEHAHGAAWKQWKRHKLGDSDEHFKALDDALQHFVGSLELRAMSPTKDRESVNAVMLAARPPINDAIRNAIVAAIEDGGSPDDIYAAIARAEAASPPVAAEGWQTVPKEPTGRMIDAGQDKLTADYGKTLSSVALSKAYRAMLSSAPPPAAVCNRCRGSGRCDAPKIRREACVIEFCPHPELCNGLCALSSPPQSKG